AGGARLADARAGSSAGGRVSRARRAIVELGRDHQPESRRTRRRAAEREAPAALTALAIAIPRRIVVEPGRVSGRRIVEVRPLAPGARTRPAGQPGDEESAGGRGRVARLAQQRQRVSESVLESIRVVHAVRVAVDAELGTDQIDVEDITGELTLRESARN